VRPVNTKKTLGTLDLEQIAVGTINSVAIPVVLNLETKIGQHVGSNVVVAAKQIVTIDAGYSTGGGKIKYSNTGSIWWSLRSAEEKPQRV